MTANIKLNNFEWTLLVNDSISKGVLQGNHWEPHITKFIRLYLQEGDVAVDVGACFGWHTLEMAQVCGKTGKVYAFEPQQINIGLLNKNLQQNDMNNVTVHEVALGHKLMKSCICNAYMEDEKNLGDSFISTHYERGISDLNIQENIGKGGRMLPLNKEVILCMPLDDIPLIGKIKFMKIDVQGFEKMVLEGGIQTISEHRPVMVIELEDPCMGMFGYTSEQLIPYIRSLDYYIYFLEHEYPCDHICVPIEKMNEFEAQFDGKIHPHLVNNHLNNNVIHGVTKRLIL